MSAIGPIDRLGWAAGQLARVAWFAGHYAAGRRVLKPLPKPDFAVGPVPDQRAFLADLRALFEIEWTDIAAGRVPAPRRELPDLRAALTASLRYFRDLPAVDARRHAREAAVLPSDNAHGGLPRYYRQNFHFQSDGWLSDESARLYDTQVEVLFTGAARTMRRRALRPIADWMAGRDQRAVRALDIGCGTGRLMRELRDALPGLRLLGLDPSEPYLAEARRHVGATARVKFMGGLAEALPFGDASLDLVVSSFLLHELPPDIRGRALAEMRRVVRSDGLVVIVDSIQRADRPDWAGLLDLFPHHFHEPYYASYVAGRLAGDAEGIGLRSVWSERAFLSAVHAFHPDS